MRQLRAAAANDVRELLPHLQTRAKEYAEDAVAKLKYRADDESKKMRDMELASKLFCDVVQKALNSSAIVLATVMERRHPFADQIKRRVDVMMFEPTVENRNSLLGTITAMIREELSRNH